MRMITSAQIRSKPEEYEPFLTHPDTGGKIEVKEFCESVVEVLGKEAGERSPPLLSFQFRLTDDARGVFLFFGQTTSS
jgi:ubiquitin thioesterase protein OTUB1